MKINIWITPHQLREIKRALEYADKYTPRDGSNARSMLASMQDAIMRVQINAWKAKAEGRFK